MNLNKYSAYIFDVDGTLYYKKMLQIEMALQLLGYYAIRLYKIKELFLLKEYRELREREDITGNAGFEQDIRSRLSKKYKMNSKQVDEVIDNWIMNRPLSLIKKYQDSTLLLWIKKLQNQNKKVYIYSDYPVEDKLGVLELKVDKMYWPDGVHIFTLKPDPAGLQHILKSNRLDCSEVIFIGDRYKKDGLCAKGAGIDYLILEKTKKKRIAQYKTLGDVTS